MEFLTMAWKYFSVVLSPVGMLLLCLLVWTKIECYQTRNRVALILNGKDEYIKELTGKTLSAVAGYAKLTGLLEEIADREVS